MAEAMQGKSPVSWKAAFGVFVITMCIYTAPAVTPALNTIYAAFSDQPTWLVSMCNSISSLTVLVGVLLFGALNQKVKWKTLASIGLLCALVFGVLPAWSFANGSIYIVLLCRLLHGFGDGLYFSLGSAWFMRMIRDEKKRGTWLNWNQTAGSVGSMVLTYLGGFFSNIQWNYTFYAYIWILLGWILMLVLFQEPKSVEEIIAEEGVAAGADFEDAKKVKLPPYVWLVVILLLLSQVAMAQGMMTFSTLMDMNGAGDAQAAGTILSFFTLVTAVFCLIGGPIQRVVRQFTAPIIFAIGGLSMLCIAFGGANIGMYWLAAIGLGIGVANIGYAMFDLSLNTNAAGTAWASSLMFFGSNLGNVLSSFVFGIFLAMGGGDMTVPCIGGACLYFFDAVVMCIANCVNKGWKQYNANRRAEKEAA